MFDTTSFPEMLEILRDRCHQTAKDKGFWGGDGAPWSFGEKIALIHSELSELFEAWRKGIDKSDKDITVTDLSRGALGGPIGTRRITAIEEEVADVFIRLMDLCGKLDIDVGRVVMAKMVYNKKRPHMHGGRKC